MTKYWSFSFNISPSNEYSGLISFPMDWLDLLEIQGTLKSLLQHHSSKAWVLWCSAFLSLISTPPMEGTIYAFLFIYLMRSLQNKLKLTSFNQWIRKNSRGWWKWNWTISNFWTTICKSSVWKQILFLSNLCYVYKPITYNVYSNNIYKIAFLLE